MAIGIKGVLDTVQALQSRNGGDVLGTKGGNSSDPAINAAFEQQMNMARNLFGDSGNGIESSAGGFEVGMINDAMMFDALSVITRLMQENNGMQKSIAVTAPQAKPLMPQAVDTQNVVQNAMTIPKKLEPGVDGSLSAQFESGSKGIAAIGWDSTGGTSYGKYQIAAKTGSMDRFLNYLDQKAPDIAERLRSAGPADTGSRIGAMPTEWQRIASEKPQQFEELQHGFIKGEYYDSARQKVMAQTGIDVNNAPPIVREVLWSTSVQHGPTGAAGIFSKAINAFLGKAEGGEFSRKLIETVYDTRKGQFGSSTERVQQAVGNRLESEKEIALNMLSSMQVNRVV